MYVAHLYLWKNRSRSTYGPWLPDASDPSAWSAVVYQLLLAKTDRALIEYWPDQAADADPQTEAQLLAFLQFLATQTIHPNLRVAVYIPQLRTPSNQTPEKVREYLSRLTMPRPELGGRSIIQHPKYWTEGGMLGLNRRPVVGWFLGASRGHKATQAIIAGGNLTGRRWAHDIQIPADGKVSVYNGVVWNFHSYQPTTYIDAYCTGGVWAPGDVMVSSGYWHIKEAEPKLARSLGNFKLAVADAKAMNPRIIRYCLNERPEGHGEEHQGTEGDAFLRVLAA